MTTKKTDLPSLDVDGDGKTIDLRPLLTDEEAKDFRKRIKAAKTDSEAAAIEMERADLKNERREARAEAKAVIREAHMAWDQRLGDLVAGIIKEDVALDIIEGAMATLVQSYIDGEDMEVVVDQVIWKASQDADRAFDFSGIPLIGWLLELYDDFIFRQIANKWRPMIGSRIAKLAKNGKPSK